MARPALRAVFSAVLIATCLVDPGRAQAVAAPNIILINFDDAAKDDVEAMPNIKSLIADQGATFDNFYATESLCCPSRSSMLLGEYVHNHGIYKNRPPHGGFKSFHNSGHERETIARELQTLGYRTGLFGKYLNGYGTPRNGPRYVPPFWNEWFAFLKAKYLGYTVNHNGRIKHFGHAPRDYSDRVAGRRARGFINGSEPFFAYVAPHAPHRPYVDPRDHHDDYPSDVPPSVTKASFNEGDVSDKPAYVRRLPLLGGRATASIAARFRHRRRMMREMDDQIGALIGDLTQSGQLANTYIFVTSDNGWMQGEHRIGSKKLVPYEESVHLPLLVRGPGIVPGTHISELASMMDLFETFSELGGGTALRDGRSLVPLLHGLAPTWRSRLLIENFDPTTPVPRFFGVVEGNYRYIEYETGEKELYDLSVDPDEVDNVAPSQPAIVADLATKLTALRTCSGSSCRTADS